MNDQTIENCHSEYDGYPSVPDSVTQSKDAPGAMSPCMLRGEEALLPGRERSPPEACAAS